MSRASGLESERMPDVLQYENITKDYRIPWSNRRVRALDSFTLSLERGEILGFLGPNGAGKARPSTLRWVLCDPRLGRAA